MSGNAISVRDLTKTFGGGRTLLGKERHKVEAVKNVSFDLGSGETLAIVGESGSGKSTLARMLVGLTEPTGGTMTIAGRDAHELRGVPARTYPQRRDLSGRPGRSFNV